MNYLIVNLNSSQMKRAVDKAIRVRPLVRPSLHSSEGASYDVRRSDGVSWSVVQFRRSPSGSCLYRCDCPAAERERPCYHVAAALLCHCGLVRSGFRSRISSCIWYPRDDGASYEVRAA